MEYTVTIEETVTENFKVTASSLEEALDIARQKYEDGKFVLEPGELQSTSIKVISQTGEETEWEEI